MSTFARPNLSFGSSVPTSGATRNGPSLGFGGGVPTGTGLANFFSFGGSGLSFGEAVNDTYAGTPTAGGFVSGDIDGAAPWQSLLSGASAALLEGIGGQRDAPTPMLQQASLGDRFGGASATSPLVLLAIVGAVGAGVYFLAK